MTDVADSDREFVQSLARGLLVIRALNLPEPRTLSDIARATGLSRAAARRLALTLERLGYVRQAAGGFALTPQILELGYAYLSSLTLPQVVQPHLERLTELVHETSSAAVLDRDHVIYIARAPVRRIVTEAISVGTRFPAHATSMGRVLLAGVEADVLSDLSCEVEKIRGQGWAIVDPELEPGLRSIAVPIRDPGGAVVAAVNLSAFAARTGVAELEHRLLPPLLETAAGIERDLMAMGTAERCLA